MATATGARVEAGHVDESNGASLPMSERGDRDMYRQKVVRQSVDDYELFDLQPQTPTIGAEVSGVDLTRIPDDELIEELRRAWLDWKVLVFRDQYLTRRQHVEFSSWWGDVAGTTSQNFLGTDVSGVSRLGSDKGRNGAVSSFHADGPPFTSYRALTLLCRRTPPVGGDTVCVDMGSAYDHLPDDLKDEIAALKARTTRTDFPEYPHITKVASPLVHVHPFTGRRSLYVDEILLDEIIGLDPARSAELLTRLRQEIRIPEFQFRIRWAVGTVALLDNHAILHYGCNDFAPDERVLERTYIHEQLERWSMPPDLPRNELAASAMFPDLF